MQLKVLVDDQLRKKEIVTDASAVEQIIFNLVDNACKYAAGTNDNRIDLVCTERGKRVEFEVRDYGHGIDASASARLFKPFCKSDIDAANSAQGVGLGLALCRRLAADLGGTIRLSTQHEQGASFVLSIPA